MSMHDEIAKVAYELYEKSGRVAGKETENWLGAEKTVLARNAERAKSNEAKSADTPKPRQKQSVGAKANTAKI